MFALFVLIAVVSADPPEYKVEGDGAHIHSTREVYALNICYRFTEGGVTKSLKYMKKSFIYVKQVFTDAECTNAEPTAPQITGNWVTTLPAHIAYFAVDESSTTCDNSKYNPHVFLIHDHCAMTYNRDEEQYPPNSYEKYQVVGDNIIFTKYSDETCTTETESVTIPCGGCDSTQKGYFCGTFTIPETQPSESEPNCGENTCSEDEFCGVDDTCLPECLPTQYFDSNKKCKTECDPGHFIKEGTKECIDSCDTTSHVVINRECKSKTPCSGTTSKLDIASNTCVATCGSGKVEILNECFPKRDCSGELTNKKLDIATNTCVETCASDKIEILNECFTKRDCSGESTNKKLDITTNTCVATCGTGKVEILNVCFPKAPCSGTTPKLDISTNTCVSTCGAGTVDILNECFPKRDCSGETTNKKLDVATNTCVETCATGKIEINNECVFRADCQVTPDTPFFDASTNTCKPKTVCSGEETKKKLNVATNECVETCAEGKVELSNECFDKAVCTTENPNYDASTNTCVKYCPNIRPVVVNKECRARPDCQQTTETPVYDAATNTCIARATCTDEKPLYEEATNICKACPEDKPKYDATKKECIPDGVKGVFLILTFVLFFLF